VDKVACLAGGDIGGDGFGGLWEGDIEVFEALGDGCLWHVVSNCGGLCGNMGGLLWEMFGPWGTTGVALRIVIPYDGTGECGSATKHIALFGQ